MIAALFLTIFLFQLAATKILTRQTDIGDEVIKDVINAGEIGADAAQELFETGAEGLGNFANFFFSPGQSKSTSSKEQPSNVPDTKTPMGITVCDQQ